MIHCGWLAPATPPTIRTLNAHETNHESNQHPTDVYSSFGGGL